MTNHVQFAFISILLGLVMFFAYQSMSQKQEATFDFREGIACPKNAFCDFSCDSVVMTITSTELISSKGYSSSISEFISSAKTTSRECQHPIEFITIYAPPELEHGVVMAITNQITKELPDVKLSWGGIGN